MGLSYPHGWCQWCAHCRSLTDLHTLAISSPCEMTLALPFGLLGGWSSWSGVSGFAGVLWLPLLPFLSPLRSLLSLLVAPLWENTWKHFTSHSYDTQFKILEWGKLITLGQGRGTVLWYFWSQKNSWKNLIYVHIQALWRKKKKSMGWWIFHR